MRIYLGIIGVLIVLAVIALVVQPADWLWWALGALIVLGVGVPLLRFVLRGNAPDDKFPWE
jgi:hypothetical protein